MRDKLSAIEKRYDELTILLGDAGIISRQDEWRRLTKEHSELVDIVEKYREIKKVEIELKEYKDILADGSDREMCELASEELKPTIERLERLLEEVKILLLPKDPDAARNVVIEIRPAAGGDEAALFGARLMRMYTRFAERNRWKINEIDVNMTELGGVKEAVFTLIGKGAYAKLKYESGVHRVQRIPATESQGRVHTSTVTVAVLPEVEDVEIEINEKDLKIDTYRSGGAGGQHVNKTESAIRITHLPTGIVVQCQNERSQIQNREQAMKMLRTLMYDHVKQEADKKYSDNRRAQVGTGDRSERIRTYNFPQGRVTDHRIGLTLYSLDNFLDGDIYDMIEGLAIAEQAALLRGDKND